MGTNSPLQTNYVQIVIGSKWISGEMSSGSNMYLAFDWLIKVGIGAYIHV